MRRYRFHEFILSPRRRVLLRRGVEQPLIPRYFDLLHYLIQRRGDAVHRRDIFDAVWTDAIVSDSALSQAIRTIRRVLDDDPREPTYVRTVARHGYQFVFADVLEEDDAAEPPASATPSVRAPAALETSPPVPAEAADPFTGLIDRLLRPAPDAADEEDQRDAAERLHALGTVETLARIADVPGSARARALLRDTRWDTAVSAPVPILGAPDAASTTMHLLRIRARRAAGLAATRWTAASTGGALAGAAGGVLGGLLLTWSAATPLTGLPVLALLGFASGAVAGAGVASGMAAAEVAFRSWRVAGVVLGGALGAGLVGLFIQFEAQWLLQLLTGLAVPVGGGLEGLVLGAALAAGYGISTRTVTDGAPAPRGPERAKVVLATALACAAAALALSLAGRPLVGGTLHMIARAVSGHSLLGPLGQLIGEPDFGRVTAALIATGEGLTFGCGVALGLTRRG